MNEEEEAAIKEIKEIIGGDFEYPSILNEIKKTNYGNKDLIKLWNAIDDESSNYLEYSDFDIAKAIVYLVNLVDKQQKEIEELKHDNSILCEIAYKRIHLPYTRVYTGTDNFISKDKIKELREIDNIDYLQFRLKELIGE